MKFIEYLLLLTTIFSGLIAGFFFTYSISVMLGLKKLSDREFLSAMQSINKEVLNWFFFLVFFGTLILLALSYFQMFSKNKLLFTILLISFIVYGIGVILITGMMNVPLNNQLEAFQITSETEQNIQKMRQTFEKPWCFWNNVRTSATLLSFIGVALVSFLHKMGN